MTKKIISIFIALAMILSAIPLTISASEPDTIYISISDDKQFVTDSNGTPMAFYPVTLDELAEIDLGDYYLDGYAYDADGDNVPELTALHLFIYVHEIILGLDWSDVYVSGSAGSIYFAGGLFGFSDENLRYDLNGAYPAVDGWGLTADQIVLNNGDFLNIAHYTSWAFWGDSTTGFHYFTDSQGNLNHTYNTSVNEELELGLVRSYSDWMNGGAAAFDPEIGYTVYYGTAYGVPTGSTVTDDNGLVNISFPSGGTWYVWTDGGYGMENPEDIVSAPAFATVKVIKAEAEPIDVFVTVADKGEVVMANEVVTVTDLDKSGDFNVDEVLFAAHEDAYDEGSQAGYASEMTPYGLSITKLWGDDSGNYGYWLNDASCWSLADTVNAGDSVVAFVYQNTEVWDSYSRFSQDSYTAMAETSAIVTLEKAGYDANWNTVFEAHKGAALKIYDSAFNEISAEAYKVTDNGDGTYSVIVKNIGEYTVAAYDNATPIVPALCTLTVTENPDVVYADAVEAKIDDIGNVNIFNYKKIYAAREAYDALTDSQKTLVENYFVLTDAENSFATLLADASDADHKAIYEATGTYINSLGTPSVGSTGGEWMVIDLTRSGYDCPEGYYENVVNYVNEKINDKEQLHRAKSTDNSRVILALTSAGYDVTDVDGHNLLMGLTDMTYLKKQGINGPIWALIAFDCHDYEIPVNADATEQATREKIIAYILEKQLEDGGWALSGKVADPDMTGMAIQSLAPYYETNAKVKAAIDKAIICLSEKQYDNGGFGSIDGICSESCAQVIVALTALGINPETDPRFVKNGVSVVDAMCLFAVEGGGFAHIPDAGINGMATEQAQYALASYFRFLDAKTSLYDMSDVDIYTKDEKAADAVEAMISAIGTVTAESKSAIEEARAAYDALTDEQKALVENYETLTTAETALAKIENDIKAADDVEAMISAIGTVTAESKDAIEEARAAYDALTDEQKALVENYEVLTSAETEYSELTTGKELSFFEKIINWFIKLFNWIISLFKNIFSF
ncbi:MAG: hypothetical protein IKB93_03500 [Clostridia bacterium]|nr:hypothetical protein [Clostridia bacterium]